MQRFINDPDFVVEDMLKGIIKARPDLSILAEDQRVVHRSELGNAHVGLVTGGGSGHEPGFLGYTGKGLLDATAVGEVFTSPSARSFLNAFRKANTGMGVCCLYGNYSGDNMNVKMAVRMAKKEGIEVKTVVCNDDICSAPYDEREKRRGGTGMIFLWKIAGAMAAAGANLDEVAAVSNRALEGIRSLSIGLEPCTLPAVGHPNFTIQPGAMAVGIGLHGEPAILYCPLESASKIAERIVDAIITDFRNKDGDEMAVIVSGLGATPLMELHIIYGEMENLLNKRGIRVYRRYVGNYFTSLNMNGISVAAMLLDDELKALIDAPCESMALTQF